MTIIGAINQIDSLKPNTYSVKQKIQWLSQLDAIVKRQVIDAHDGSEQISFDGYDENTDVNTVLLMPAPFDIAYLYWLEAQVHYAYEDIDMYNSSILMFNTHFMEYKADYKRNHTAKGNGRFRF